MRKVFAAGNWKMNNGIAETEDFMKGFGALLENDDKVFRAVSTKKLEIAIFPPFLSLQKAMECKPDPLFIVGAQNVNDNESGAFTGEVSIPMLKELGIKYAIIGHSERRHIFGETNEFLNKKLLAAVAADIIPVYCVGELFEEREAGKTFDVVREQLVAGMKDIKASADKFIIAYEPVWAIGTGKNATPEDAEEVCKFVRETVKELYGEEFAENILILYGGSVKPANTADIMAQPDIDGVLVGGASLKYGSFMEICKAAI